MHFNWFQIMRPFWYYIGDQVATWCAWHHMWPAPWEGPRHWAHSYPACAIPNRKWDCSQMDLAFWSLALPGNLHRCMSHLPTSLLSSFHQNNQLRFLKKNDQLIILFCCFQDVAHEISGELQATPDLIIGNYSDGNLVACLLAHKLGVTHVRILAPYSIQFFLW